MEETGEGIVFINYAKSFDIVYPFWRWGKWIKPYWSKHGGRDGEGIVNLVILDHMVVLLLFFIFLPYFGSFFKY